MPSVDGDEDVLDIAKGGLFGSRGVQGDCMKALCGVVGLWGVEAGRARKGPHR